MASRFIIPFADVGNGISPSDGAQLFFFATGTSTPKDTYTTAAASVANANPVVSDSDGVFPDIFITGTYKVQLKDKNGVQQWEADPIVETAAATDTVYNQGGTGAVDRTVVAKWQSQPVDLLDFIPVAEHAAILARTSTFDTTTAWANALAASDSIRLPRGKVLGDWVVSGRPGLSIIGDSQNGSIIEAFTAGEYAIKFDDVSTPTSVNAPMKVFGNFTVSGSSKTKNGIKFGDGTSTAAQQNAQNSYWRNVSFEFCDHAFNKLSGNLNHNLDGCWFDGNNYDIEMRNAGTSFDAGSLYAVKCTSISNAVCSVYVETSGNTGMVKFETCGWYGHFGHQFFIEEYTPIGQPGFTIENCWSEKFSSRPIVDVTVDNNAGGTKTVLKSDLYVNRGSGITVRSSALRLLRFGSSETANVLLDDFYLADDGAITGESTVATAVDFPTTAQLNIDNAKADGVGHVGEGMVNSLREFIRLIAGFAFSCYTPNSLQLDQTKTPFGTLFVDFTTDPFTAHPAGETATIVSDGIFGTCTELTRTSAATGSSVFSPSNTLTASKNYVARLRYKVISAPADAAMRIILGDTNSFNNSTQLDFNRTGEWRTITSIGRTDGSPPNVQWKINDSSGASDIVVRFDFATVSEFDSRAEAIEYFNSGLLSSDRGVSTTKTIQGSVSQATDNTATKMFTVTIPNAFATGNLIVNYNAWNNGSGNRISEAGQIAFAFGRQVGSAVVFGASSKYGNAQAIRLGGGSITVTIANAAAVGAVGAEQTVDIEYTVNLGAASGSECQFDVELVTDTASSVTLSV